MKKLLAWAILCCMLFLMPCAMAEEAPGITAETIRVPDFGEKLPEAKEVFSFEGITLSVYGVEKTEDALLIHARLKNETDRPVVCTFQRKLTVSGQTVDRLLAKQPIDALREEEVTIAMTPMGQHGLSVLASLTTSFSFEVQLAAVKAEALTSASKDEMLAYLGYSEAQIAPILDKAFGEETGRGFDDLLAEYYLDICMAQAETFGSVNAEFQIGPAKPFEIEIGKENTGGYFVMPVAQNTLFSANGIQVFISMRLVSSSLFDDIVLPLTIVNNSSAAVRVELEDITIGGTAIADPMEAQIGAGERMETPWALPMEHLTDMTCILAVYDAETGSQIFERTPVKINGRGVNAP